MEILSATDAKIMSTQNDLVREVLVQIEKEIKKNALMGKSYLSYMFPKNIGSTARQAILMALAQAGYQLGVYDARWSISW